MATKTDIELKIVDSVDTSHTDAEVLADSASNPDAFYVGRGYLAHNGEKVIEGIDTDGTYPNMTVGKATSADFATDLSGRVEATPEVFTYRPSAGDKSIKDDNAFIRRVKGNSVVWNQLVKDNGYSNNGVVTTFNNGVFTLAGTPTSTYFNTTSAIPMVSGHKVLLQMLVVANPNNINVRFCDLDQNNTYISTSTGGGVIYTVSGQQKHYLGFYDSNLKNIDFTGLQICQMVIDLTAMFGAGDEPTTVEEFRELYPNLHYPYNAGELRNLVCSGIKTVGFNQWDEQWEVGSINQDGGNTPSTTMFRSVGYMQILQQKYCVKQKEGQVLGFRFYDENKVHISGCNRAVVETITTLIPPLNAAYMRFVCTTSNTYNNDICINLHHTGWRDGEYEPYKEVTHSLPLSQITNGEPLRKAGSVYDEINETEYIRRVGVVDLGSYDWYETPNGTFNTVVNIPDIKAVESESNYTCKKYIGVGNSSTIYAGTADNLTISTNAAGRIYIRDDAYKTGTAYAAVTALKASLSGVLLHYELAEPIVTPITTPIDFNYYVEDFGTEEALLADDSAPFSADIVYQFNAVDNIRQNRISIQKLNDIFSGSEGEYVRADGSWGYIADLKGNFFVKPTLKRIRTGISELSDTIQIIHPYLTEHIGDAKIVLMAVKRRGGSYYDRATNAKGRRKKRKAWGELHYAAMPNTEINHNTIEMSNGASFEAWQNVILTACGRIPEGLENAREPYNVNVALEDLAEFFATNGAIFVGKTPVIRLGVALRIPNPNFIDYGNGNKMWDYNDVTGKWEYKYLYSDVAEVVVKSQMLRTGGYVLGLELV